MPLSASFLVCSPQGVMCSPTTARAAEPLSSQPLWPVCVGGSLLAGLQDSECEDSAFRTALASRQAGDYIQTLRGGLHRPAWPTSARLCHATSLLLPTLLTAPATLLCLGRLSSGAEQVAPCH